MRWILLTLTVAACGPKAVTPVSEPAAAAEDIPCDQPDTFGPVVVAASDMGKLRRAPTSLAAYRAEPWPIEVCGVTASQDALLGLSCEDGTSVFADRAAVRDSRTGSGEFLPSRCGTIQDQYIGSCAEGEVTFVVDMYYCGPGENLRD